ncbi:MAG: hypothetical protein IJZ66_00190, partial [Oscillibacter sp.]|nr:hypothetical protein [Oscillibacter sp.]
MSLAAFIVGVSLLAGSILGAGKLALQTDKDLEWWRADWQETTAFKQEVSGYLKTFLEFASDSDLDWYDMTRMEQKEELLPGSENIGGPVYAAESAAAVPIKETEKTEPDAAYQKDRNVLYSISGGKSGIYYSNANIYWQSLPEGYNFYLTY